MIAIEKTEGRGTKGLCPWSKQYVIGSRREICVMDRNSSIGWLNVLTHVGGEQEKPSDPPQPIHSMHFARFESTGEADSDCSVDNDRQLNESIYLVAVAGLPQK